MGVVHFRQEGLIFMGVVGREPVPVGLYLCCPSVPSTQA